MGIFKKLKKAFKKVTGFVKKHIKRTIKAVKKVSKKIRSSKILKALAIAAAIVVTGGAALTAFGSGGALATSKLGVFMMNTSAKMVGGTVFGGSTLGKVGNFAIKTVSKPFAAIGGALGSTARVGTNLFQGKPLFQAGPGSIPVADTSGRMLTSTGSKTVSGVSGGQLAQTPFSGAAITGTVPYVAPPVVGATPVPPNKIVQASKKVGSYAAEALGTVAIGVASGYAQQELLGGDPTGGYGSNLRTEGQSNQDPLQIYAAGRGIDVGSIYNNMTYGTADPGFANSADLYTQDTMAVA